VSNDFKFNPTQIAPQTSVTVALEPKRANVAPKSPVTRQPRIASEYDEVFAQMTSAPRSELSCLLMLLQPPVWMAGLWGDEDGGWRDARTDKFFSFEQIREILDARIKELGLNADLVHAWPHSSLADRGETIADERAFRRMSFEERMNKFRVSK
jgi:hypothetical protein